MSTTNNGTSNGKRTRAKVISPAEALAMLQSAAHYCQRAGLAITYGNAAEGLTLTLPKCKVITDDSTARFVLFEVRPTQ